MGHGRKPVVMNTTFVFSCDHCDVVRQFQSERYMKKAKCLHYKTAHGITIDLKKEPPMLNKILALEMGNTSNPNTYIIPPRGTVAPLTPHQ